MTESAASPEAILTSRSNNHGHVPIAGFISCVSVPGLAARDGSDLTHRLWRGAESLHGSDNRYDRLRYEVVKGMVGVMESNCARSVLASHLASRVRRIRTASLRPELIGVRADGQLVGSLPMRPDPHKALRFSTSPRSDYEDALSVAESSRRRARLHSRIISRGSASILRRCPRIRCSRTPFGRAGHRAARLAVPGIRLSPESTHDVTHRKIVVVTSASSVEEAR